MLLRRLEEIDSLYCFFLGRRAESIKVIEHHLFTSIFEAICFFVSSEEFCVKIKSDFIQYSRLSIQEWHRIIELFCRSQMLGSRELPYHVSEQDIEDAKEPLKFLYWELFRRSPDDAGLQAHHEAMENGATLAQIIDAMINSAEFNGRERKVHLSNHSLAEIEVDVNQQYIAMVYSMVLNRSVDASGMRHHLQTLDASRLDRNSFFENVFASTEAQALRRHRPGGECIVWKEPVAAIFRTPSLAKIVETVDGHVANHLKRSLDRLTTPISQSEAFFPEGSNDDRGRPSISSQTAASIYGALI